MLRQVDVQTDEGTPDARYASHGDTTNREPYELLRVYGLTRFRTNG